MAQALGLQIYDFKARSQKKMKRKSSFDSWQGFIFTLTLATIWVEEI